MCSIMIVIVLFVTNQENASEQYIYAEFQEISVQTGLRKSYNNIFNNGMSILFCL
ncbi:hypothetical protein A35E_00193 [secondary endosymbiont of Heteropsylla cubana]|uniref:Uncharacterized protein n=1 Tax=secondary endosymbiont of Heteropsylla cubana TaxID=134287 RepID=J3Z5A8_9ENTR|nr:hypothetical protein A35E_00193 [secondary endosymbiont of Heteropsylla cubana]